MPKYRVAVCLEEGVVLVVDAANVADAEAEAFRLADDMGGTDYPKQYRPKHVHREFWTQDATQEVDDG